MNAFNSNPPSFHSFTNACILYSFQGNFTREHGFSQYVSMKELSELLSLDDGQIRDFLASASASEDDKSSSSSSQRGVPGAASCVTSGVATPVVASGIATPIHNSGRSTPVKSTGISVPPTSLPGGSSSTSSATESTAARVNENPSTSSSSSSSSNSTTHTVISNGVGGVGGSSDEGVASNSDIVSRFQLLANSLKVTWVSRQQVNNYTMYDPFSCLA